jgi:dsRNA-specific ribonuclease
MKEKLVKYYADVFEAQIGAIFIDSADFDVTQLICLRMLKSKLLNSIPNTEHIRTKV